MVTKVAINGLGRIGRIVLRCLIEKAPKDVEIVAVNDLISAKDMTYYIKYDSTHGKAPFEVKAEGSDMIMGGKQIPMFAEKTPRSCSGRTWVSISSWSVRGVSPKKKRP